MRGEWFATGDRYERTDDGAYAYVGRVDDMLKVGGLWVSPIDMEHVLMSTRACSGSASSGSRSTTRAGSPRSSSATASRATSSRMSCGVVQGRACAATSTRTSCEFVDELPRTLTGKVQRFRLRERMETSPA